MELVKLLHVHQYSVDNFSYSSPSGILGSDRSRIPLKPVLGGVRIVSLSFSSHEQTQYTKPDVSLNCRFSIFLQELFFQII